MRSPALKQASNAAASATSVFASLAKSKCRFYHRPQSPTARLTHAVYVALSAVRHSSSSRAREKKRAEDRDFIVSVLEASATRRDAKGYLQKYAPPVGEDAPQKSGRGPDPHGMPDQTFSSIRVVNQSPKFIQGTENESSVFPEGPINLAIVKMTLPQELDDKLLSAIAKTFSQLRKLGLSWRVQQAVEAFGDPGCVLLEQCVSQKESPGDNGRGLLPCGVNVEHPHLLLRAFHDNAIVVLPPVSNSSDMQSVVTIDADATIVALTGYFCGLQLDLDSSVSDATAAGRSTGKVASVEKFIILDPLGGIPVADEHESCHRYINLEQEQNPLIHNLLTDKPVFSSSLPMERVRSGQKNEIASGEKYMATLIKRGMPLTVYPDPTVTTWLPPGPGASRLRLTDTCIDLPRLVHLINDSFDRELDVQHYLDRVNENLAGIIIAGEYEGGAILTWEKPFGLDDETAYDSSRLVPYLDKFAVLKSRQGSGGVADVVFNAMVRGCLPEGVCWRSRQDNPVNKWYFERSLGTWNLRDTKWTMFWTTRHLPLSDPKLLDYENVCRHIEPSWADSNPPD
ncbi:Amino-acid acetyltransferase [Colletotrichum orbiculare MAFF 240422]|uniref:Amino-acid acetyltransferase, mitochondrial n=1 Tax=Colletotrichum orbiculare (strain 104-T / ATCC 96160 / CBS 514.97 / LARS 414 / MAFF 240422) TaxID=1213857 RepID=A0A484FXJ5_COLOR|nr:Amino-acid acetyltransferase [Colletotrichum orbiculare MAFF 240422]